jgi:hypothetical protein
MNQNNISVQNQMFKNGNSIIQTKPKGNIKSDWALIGTFFKHFYKILAFLLAQRNKSYFNR